MRYRRQKLLVLALVLGARTPLFGQVPGKTYENPGAYQWIQGMLDRIISQTGWDRSQFTLTLLDAPEVNAFAGAKGDVYVTLGMMQTVDSDDELAAVLAHEVTHVVKYHVKKASQTQLLTGGLVSVLSSVTKNPNLASGARLAGNLATLKFARGEEEEADAAGFQYFVNAGYAPTGFVTMLDKLGSSAKSAAFLDFLSTHPNSGKRAENARDWLAALPENVRTRTQRLTYGQFRPGSAQQDAVQTIGFAQGTESSRSRVQETGSSGTARRGSNAGDAAEGSVNHDEPIGWLRGRSASSDPPAKPPGLKTGAPSSSRWKTIKLKNGKTLQVESGH